MYRNQEVRQIIDMSCPRIENVHYLLFLLSLTQSMAIMEYINELKPEAGLLPADRIQRAKVPLD